jgi:hypothetical protein
VSVPKNTFDGMKKRHLNCSQVCSSKCKVNKIVQGLIDLAISVPASSLVLILIFWMLVSLFQAGLLYFFKIAVQPLFLYTIFWTLMLAATVTVAALSLEMGFSSSISPSMEIAEACSLQGNKVSPSCRQCFWLPLDGPYDGLCVPANLFKKSRIDIAVPPIFAALVVAASALFVQGLGLWNY